MDIEFEWDESKNRLNQQKHGIRFEDALYVFADLSRWDAQDARKDYGEERRITIGLMGACVCSQLHDAWRSGSVDFSKEGK